MQKVNNTMNLQLNILYTHLNCSFLWWYANVQQLVEVSKNGGHAMGNQFEEECHQITFTHDSQWNNNFLLISSFILPTP